MAHAFKILIIDDDPSILGACRRNAEPDDQTRRSSHFGFPGRPHVCGDQGRNRRFWTGHPTFFRDHHFSDRLLETVTDLLETAGYQALAALGGAQGLNLARTERPDLILVDYHMPEMNGLAVAERLKADAATRRIPVIALTSGTAADANKLVAAGCIGFIPKPFDVEAFPGLITEFVRATVARRP